MSVAIAFTQIFFAEKVFDCNECDCSLLSNAFLVKKIFDCDEGGRTLCPNAFLVGNFLILMSMVVAFTPIPPSWPRKSLFGYNKCNPFLFPTTTPVVVDFGCDEYDYSLFSLCTN